MRYATSMNPLAALAALLFACPGVALYVYYKMLRRCGKIKKQFEDAAADRDWWKDLADKALRREERQSIEIFKLAEQLRHPLPPPIPVDNSPASPQPPQLDFMVLLREYASTVDKSTAAISEAVTKAITSVVAPSPAHPVDTDNGPELRSPFYANEATYDDSDPTDGFLPRMSRDNVAFVDADDDEPFGIPGMKFTSPFGPPNA